MSDDVHGNQGSAEGYDFFSGVGERTFGPNYENAGQSTSLQFSGVTLTSDSIVVVRAEAVSPGRIVRGGIEARIPYSDLAATIESVSGYASGDDTVSLEDIPGEIRVTGAYGRRELAAQARVTFDPSSGEVVGDLGVNAQLSDSYSGFLGTTYSSLEGEGLTASISAYDKPGDPLGPAEQGLPLGTFRVGPVKITVQSGVSNSVTLRLDVVAPEYGDENYDFWLDEPVRRLSFERDQNDSGSNGQEDDGGHNWGDDNEENHSQPSPTGYSSRGVTDVEGPEAAGAGPNLLGTQSRPSNIQEEPRIGP